MKPRALFHWIAFATIPILLAGKGVETGPQVTPHPSMTMSDTLSMIWWNVENFFDTIDDVGVSDAEFTPRGSKRWDSGRFWWKTRMIAKGIVSSASGKPPDLIALCEVENANCLDALISVLPWGWDYWSMHRDGPDFRGIDLALLYRHDRVSISHAQWIASPNASREAIKSRVHLRHLPESTAIDILWVHLPSQYRPEADRRLHAMQGYLDEGLGDSLDLCVGDFNASPNGPLGEWMAAKGWQFIQGEGPAGSYVYRGHWEELDQVWALSNPMGTQVEVIPFGLQRRNGKPYVKRSYRSAQYIGGASDHLPLRIAVVITEN